MRAIVRELVACRDQLLRARDLDALEVLEHDHVVAAQLRVDARHDHVRACRRGLREPLGRARLAREVELELDEARHLGDQRPHVDAALHAHDDPDDAAQHAEVERDDPRDLGVADLHDDLAAVAQRRAVHLRQRSGGEGPAIDRREDLVERAAEVALDERRAASRRAAAAPRRGTGSARR